MNLNPANQLFLFGHHSEFINFIKLYENKKLPNKILLSGEKGIGKSTLGYHIINFILSKNEEFAYDNKNFAINPENKSFKLIINRSNPNFNLIDIEPDKKNIDINQIRNLILTLNIKHRDINVGKIGFSLLLIRIKKVLSLGSSITFSKALIEFLFKYSILSIKINLDILLNVDLLVKVIISLI